MSRVVTGIVFLMLLGCGSTQAATLSDLLADSRALVDETDTLRTAFPDSQWTRWVNLAQSKIAALGGYIPKEWDYYWAEGDSLGVALPADFKYVSHVMVWIEKYQWESVRHNRGFAIDTAGFQFDATFRTVDTAILYLRGANFTDDMLIRVVYRAVASNLVALTDTSQVHDDMRVFICEEVVRYYFQALRAFQQSMAARKDNREDMAILKGVLKQ